MKSEDELAEKMEKEFEILGDVVSSLTTHESYLRNVMTNLEKAVSDFTDCIEPQELMSNPVIAKLFTAWFDCLDAVVLCAEDMEQGLKSEANIANMLLIKSDFLEEAREVLNNESGSIE